VLQHVCTGYDLHCIGKRSIEFAKLASCYTQNLWYDVSQSALTLLCLQAYQVEREGCAVQDHKLFTLWLWALLLQCNLPEHNGESSTY
jgi:hypothetical protein